MSVPSQGLDFATNSAVFLTTPTGTWPPPSTWLLQCLRYQHWQLLCAALVLLSSLLHSEATTFFCHRIQSKPLMKPLSKCWLPSFVAAPGRQSPVMICLGAPSDLPSPVKLTIFCVLLRACAYWRCTGVYMHFSLVSKYIFLQNLTDEFWMQGGGCDGSWTFENKHGKVSSIRCHLQTNAVPSSRQSQNEMHVHYVSLLTLVLLILFKCKYIYF